MEPRLIELPEKKVVGLGARFFSAMSPRKNNAVVIPELWHRFVNREIANRAGPSWGLVETLPAAESPAPGEMFYIAAAEVTTHDGAAADFLRRTIGGGRYASFTHVGALSGLPETMGFIYGKWLPASGRRLRPAAHLELYDQRFDPASATSEFDILLPVG